MERDPRKDLKVGLFVFGAVLLGGLAVFMLGGSSELFEDRYTLNTKFNDVAGLREGAVVRLGGFDVGEVKSISFSEDIGVKEIFVELSVFESYQARIRADSVARIETEGMLGDKYISISVGSVEEEILLAEGWLSVTENVPLVEYQKIANEVLADLQDISHKINLALGDDDEATKASVANVVASVENILNEAESGNGLIHALVYDDSLTRKLNRTATNLEHGTSDLAEITEEVRTGEGLANELIYGDEGEKLAIQLGDLAAALEKIVGDIGNEDSVIHALIYDPDKAQLVEDLKITAANLRDISEGIEEGDGTLGMLAQDPALYEDLRALVNGAERNKLLRYYVRKTVEEGEKDMAEPWEP